MLVALLEDRFALWTHRETRTVSGYALLVGKDGPRFDPPEESDKALDAEERSAQMQR